jgi:D-3-phosphoglycerate dehydrogenase
MGIVVFDDPKSNPRVISFIPKRLIDFMNKGTTYMSGNFPNLQLPAIDKSHRLIHIHKNVPGIMAQINTIFAKHHINIVGQFLMTNETVG